MMVRPRKTTPVRITDEAIKWVRIASGFTGESLASYVSRILVEQGKRDTDRYYAETKKTNNTKGAKA